MRKFEVFLMSIIAMLLFMSIGAVRILDFASGRYITDDTGNGYLTFLNGSVAERIAMTPETCMIRSEIDVGTNAGGAAATTEQVRRMSVTRGDCDDITLPHSGDSMTADTIYYQNEYAESWDVATGDYLIKCYAAAYATDSSSVYLYNETDTAIITDCVGDGYANLTEARAAFSCRATFAATKELSLRHFTETARSVYGLGIGGISDGGNKAAFAPVAACSFTRIY